MLTCIHHVCSWCVTWIALTHEFCFNMLEHTLVMQVSILKIKSHLQVSIRMKYFNCTHGWCMSTYFLLNIQVGLRTQTHCCYLMNIWWPGALFFVEQNKNIWWPGALSCGEDFLVSVIRMWKLWCCCTAENQCKSITLLFWIGFKIHRWLENGGRTKIQFLKFVN